MKPEDRFSSIENKLHGLIPPTMSEEGQQRLETTIDELSGETTERTSFFQPDKWSVAAAVIVSVSLTCTLLYFSNQPSSEVVTLNKDTATNSNMILLTSTNRIDYRQDDGLILPTDGNFPHYRYRYQVTDEERVRDPKSGTIITLRQPREEIITVPVTQF